MNFFNSLYNNIINFIDPYGNFGVVVAGALGFFGSIPGIGWVIAAGIVIGIGVYCLYE
jgi:hypothetical protein